MKVDGAGQRGGFGFLPWVDKLPTRMLVILIVASVGAG
jgi:hypothetical protein